MADHFRIIAIRPLQPSLQDGRVIHMEKVQSIQKALFDKTDWLFFYRGITIDQEHRLKKSRGTLTLGDVYRMLFGAEIDETRFLDRPLSKMKSDLLKDMGVVK